MLIVEDNHVNQLVAVSILEYLGFSTAVAGNGLEALRVVRAQPVRRHPDGLSRCPRWTVRRHRGDQAHRRSWRSDAGHRDDGRGRHG